MNLLKLAGQVTAYGIRTLRLFFAPQPFHNTSLSVVLSICLGLNLAFPFAELVLS